MTKYQLQAGPVRLSEFRDIAGLPKASVFSHSLHGNAREQYKSLCRNQQEKPVAEKQGSPYIRTH